MYRQVKKLIKLMKYWRDGVEWRQRTYRPNNYLLSLLVIKAAQQTHS